MGNAEIPESHCVVFAHSLSGAKRERKGAKLSAAFAKIPQLEVNLEEEGNRSTELLRLPKLNYKTYFFFVISSEFVWHRRTNLYAKSASNLTFSLFK